MQRFQCRLRESAFIRATAIVIGLAGAGSNAAWAQSNATTTIFGVAKAHNGAAVVLKSLATSVQRCAAPRSVRLTAEYNF
jgi:hypothetical protein